MNEKPAAQSIRSKAAHAVREAEATAIKSILAFLFFVLASVPFMHGMPLNSIFRPWGQLLLAGCALAFAWAMFAALGFASAWSIKNEFAATIATRLTDGIVSS